MSSQGKRAVFFDRDDTLIVNVPYLTNPEAVMVFPEARKELQRLAHAGFMLFVVSNQSAIGRGYATHEQVKAVMREMERQLLPAKLDGIYYSPDAPDAPSTTRKPAPGLILEIQRLHQIDLSHSYMLGDKECDIQCGKRAGCTTVWVHRDMFEKPETAPDYSALSLTEATDYILSHI